MVCLERGQGFGWKLRPEGEERPGGDDLVESRGRDPRHEGVGEALQHQEHDPAPHRLHQAQYHSQHSSHIAWIEIH